uniref:Molybdopterin synthase catalytic subunit n=1 Tax=Phallusia mammillata TaxID=59560 RepID=A0A6F9DLN5_9ASCI|nr:molybdopterin synthase catalytic subunit [Phallusia mammillata]
METKSAPGRFLNELHSVVTSKQHVHEVHCNFVFVK